MKKEISKKAETRTMLPQVMEKYGCVFSIELSNGFAHLKFIGNEMFVTWLDSEGYLEEERQDIPFADIERVANFMREMKELRLPDHMK